jgi:hypothetical protein
VALKRARHPQSRSLLGGEAKAAVVGRIAYEDDRTMTAAAGGCERMSYQCGADATAAAIAGDGHRPE